jgi:methyltransferase (TIGR00027 family)
MPQQPECFPGIILTPALNMEQSQELSAPDNTAVRTALWRALHVQVDAKPPIIEDEVGLKLIAPPDGWQQRPDMKYTRRLRASIIARARFIEDLMIEQSQQGISQYVILGAGLDTFAQRRTDIASGLHVYEIDQPHTLAWKRQRLIELGFGVPGYLHFVPVNFETSSWWEELLKARFNINKPAVVACTGVTLYLTKEAIFATLTQLARLAPGSKLAITFYLPMELLDEEDKPIHAIGEQGAREAGTPFVSFFAPGEIVALASNAGLKDIKTISTKDMEQRYFAGRSDNLLPASGEVFLLATT